jgi:hypothetical protein
MDMGVGINVEPILSRSKGLYIYRWDNIASVTDNPLREPKKQFIKIDGQGREFITFRRHKILLEELDIDSPQDFH